MTKPVAHREIAAAGGSQTVPQTVGDKQTADDDAELRAIAAAWPTLPTAIRAAIVTLVAASTPTH